MIHIEKATPNDVEAIFKLIYELAIYEKAPEKVSNSPEQLLKDGFGEHPLFVCFVAKINNEIVGISFCYTRYSTWIGKCLYLEDLIVTEKQRGNGLGKALLEHTLNYAKENDYKRVNWQVLDWNISAINFYQTFNAQLDSEWVNAWVDL